MSMGIDMEFEFNEKMLNLDMPDKPAIESMKKHGIDIKDIIVAQKADIEFNGDFGTVWLMIDEKCTTLYRLSMNLDTFDTYELEKLASPYVDNYYTTSRLLAYKHENPIPKKGDKTDEEYRALLEDYNDNDPNETIIISDQTNSCKRKLFAFINIWERLIKGETVLEDDPIFDQFSAKCPKCGKVYADQQRKICDDCINKKGTIVRLLAYFKNFKVQFICVMICMLVSSAIALLNPIISGKLLYDQVITKTSYDDNGNIILGKLHEIKYVYLVVGLIFLMAALALLISIIQNRANAYMSTRVTKNMKDDIFKAMQKLSMSYFNSNPTGKLINRVNYDAVKIRSFFIDGVPYFIFNVLNFIGLTIFLFTINWKLTLIVFIPVPIIVLMFKFMLPKLWRMFSRQWRCSSSMNAMLGDSLNGIRVVKAFSKEADESARFYKYSTKLYNANLKSNLLMLTIFPVIALLIGMSSQAIWGFGGIYVMGGKMTYGEFTTYLGYIGMIFGPLNFFTNFTNLVTDTMNSAVRMFEILDMIPEISDSNNAVELPVIKGEIEFDKVNFHYIPNRPLFKSVSFKINAGDHVGLVGHTGSGKSTIANLITRMYDVISGEIKIDGYNVKDIKIDSLRKNIAIVSQEIFLFSGTIAENIKYAKSDATMQEIIDAAHSANAHDFIMDLPEGYQTMIGSGSRSLSGGERQRISIARALLLKPSLLILDEATAAMDTETERLISEAIEKLIVGRTTITIAHRLSTLKDCNYLMVIENGEIVERGTAEALIEQKGVYYKLYTLQNEQMKKVMQGI